jgi:predicted RNase H-like nuclease (RuvC/YqgF family)
MMNVSNQKLKIIFAHLAPVISVLLLFAPGVFAQKSSSKRITPPPPPQQITQQEAKELSDAASRSRANLIEASKNYRESLERLLALQKQEEESVAALLEKNRGLLDAGIIARREVEVLEQSLTAVRNKITETKSQLDSVDHMVAEVRAAEELAKNPGAGAYNSTTTLIRYVGSSRWSMSDLDKIDAFFRLKFGRVLPVSALGQTETHTHLGLDHHEAIDVAVHPDSPEGQELINYLRYQKISFIAIRGAIPGSSTGAHIHIGPTSKRVSLAN